MGGVEAGEQGLPQLVVEEAGPPGGLVDPHDRPAAGLGQAGRGLGRVLPAQLGGQVEVELLAQDGPHRQQLHRRRCQQLQPAGEEERRLAGRLHVGQALVVDHPPPGTRPVRGLDEGAALHQSPEDGRSHERAAFGQGGHRPDGVLGERARHRLGQAAQAARLQRGQGDGGDGVERAQEVVGRHLLGAEGGHHQDPGAVLAAPGALLPVGQEPQRRAVRPLAVVEEDDDGRRARSVGPRRRRSASRSAPRALMLRVSP